VQNLLRMGEHPPVNLEATGHGRDESLRPRRTAEQHPSYAILMGRTSYGLP
jgi:hypothetical protein